MPPIGISTGCFYRTPIEEVLHWFGSSGFSELEICSFPAHLDFHQTDQVEQAAKALAGAGLIARSFHAPFADHIDIASWDKLVRKESVSEMRRACEAAGILGVEFIVLHPGPEKEGNLGPHEWYPKMQVAADSLNQIAEYCRELGIKLLFENMLPHLMFGHVSDILYLLGAVRSTNVGTCLDTGHAYLSGDLSQVANKLSGHLRMIHVNDNRGKWDDHLPPGRGDIDWTAFVKQLCVERFHGTLILELSGNGTPEEIMEGARNARRYLEDLFENYPCASGVV